MKLIDANKLEQDGYVLTREYRQDKDTMVREVIKLSEVPSVDFSEIKEQALSCAAELLKLVAMISKIEKQ